METKKEIFICGCGSVEHQIIARLDDDTWGKDVFIAVYLKHRSFFKRLIYGIKYIFGYKCRYGAFEEFILDPSDAGKLQEIINFIK